MYRKNLNAYYFILTLILLFFATLTLIVSYSNRIENDAPFHALISREIFEKGTLIESTTYIRATEDQFFPVAYPILFHLAGANVYSLIGADTFRILPMLYGLLSLCFFAIMLKNISKNSIAVVIGVFALSFNPYLIDYSSKYFMEIALVFSVITALTYSIKYLETKNLANLFIASIFFGLSVGIKQQGFLVIPIYFALIVYVYYKLKSFKNILISLFFFFLISAGPIFYLFQSTGSILYPGDNPPKLIQIVEEPLRSLFGFELLKGNDEWSIINEGRRLDELIRWRNLDSVATAWITQDIASSVPWLMLTIFLLLILLKKIIINRGYKEFILVLFIIIFNFLLYYLARPRYALPTIIIPSLAIFYLVIILYKLRINLYTKTLFICLIVVLTLASFNKTYSSYLKKDNFGYFGMFIENRELLLEELYNSIKADKSYDYSVLSPLPYETAYYTKRISVWANPYGGIDLFQAFLNDDEVEAVRIFKKYKSKYIIIYNDRYMNYSNWVGISPANGFLKKINHSPNFKLHKENQAGRVYEIL